MKRSWFVPGFRSPVPASSSRGFGNAAAQVRFLLPRTDKLAGGNAVRPFNSQSSQPEAPQRAAHLGVEGNVHLSAPIDGGALSHGGIVPVSHNRPEALR